MTKFLNISTDNTLGGNSPSDEKVASEKAVKGYVDAHSGGGSTYSAGDGISIATRLSGYSTVGTVEFYDGILVAASVYLNSSNYVYKEIPNIDTSKPFKYVTKLNFGTYLSQGAVIDLNNGSGKSALYVGWDPYGANGALRLYASSNGTSFDIADGVAGSTYIYTNSTKFIETGWDGSKYYVKLSNDGQTWGENEIEVSSSTPIHAWNRLTFGYYTGDGSGEFMGECDFNVVHFEEVGGVVWNPLSSTPDANIISVEILQGSTPPTTSTIGYIGQHYTDTTTGKVYVCSAIDSSTYTWKEIQTTTNLVTSLSSTSTDTQYPSAKCVYDFVESQSGGVKTNNLFDNKWCDYELNDQNWLRADTFSWQDGTVYSEAYSHLVSGLGETTSGATFYGWVSRGDVIYTKTDSPSDGSTHYYDENGNLLGTILSYNPPFLSAGGTVYDRDSSYDFTGSSTSYSATQKTETIGSYTITYYEAADGHKIILPDQEQTAINIYNESGVAWYYILDTTNQRFKLPRINPTREELIQIVRAKGNDISLGLTDGTIDVGLLGSATYMVQNTSNAFNKPVGTTVSGGTAVGTVAMGITTDSTKSGIISDVTDSTSVYKGKKYLYFYVGEFSQSATEQTAGLNSELFNGKVDLNASNLSTQGKSLISGLGMPSNSYDDLTVGASGSQYTAPSNGYFFVGATVTQPASFIQLSSSADFATNWTPGGSGYNAAYLYIPVKAGDVVTLYYSYGTINEFRFIYAQGDI